MFIVPFCCFSQWISWGLVLLRPFDRLYTSATVSSTFGSKNNCLARWVASHLRPFAAAARFVVAGLRGHLQPLDSRKPPGSIGRCGSRRRRLGWLFLPRQLERPGHSGRGRRLRRPQLLPAAARRRPNDCPHFLSAGVGGAGTGCLPGPRWTMVDRLERPALNGRCLLPAGGRLAQGAPVRVVSFCAEIALWRGADPSLPHCFDDLQSF